MEKKEYDLFGNEVKKAIVLKELFGENPFSILDTKTSRWQNRKRKWLSLGIKSEISRDNANFSNMKDWTDKKRKSGQLSGNILPSDTSIFDPVLCELIYKWFCIENGNILDPFCGGSVRGIVANYLGYHYTGIDIRKEQIDSNRQQAIDILSIDNQPQWYVGDSNQILDQKWTKNFDMVFSCPPYVDLEKYSDLEGDISNMEYSDFKIVYEDIICKSCKLLKEGGYAVFVVGEVRDKHGNYYGFVPDTINAFMKCNMKYYNEAILSTSLGGAAIRAVGNMKNKKLVKVHQNILIFKK